MGPLLALAVVLAQTGEAPVSAPPLIDADVPLEPVKHGTFGLSLDVSLPAGVGASVVLRPFWFAAIAAGGNTNAAGPGVHASLTLYGWDGFVQPVAGVEYGHLFDGDANGAVGSLMRLPSFANTLVTQVQYDYFTVDGGVEIGGRRFAVILRVGYSWVNGTIDSFPSALKTLAADPSLEVSVPTLHVTMPSVRLGGIFYF